MVFEYLINPQRAEKKPWQLFFMGLFYPSLAILLSLWVFKSYISINMIALTTMAALPLIYNSIKDEEQKDFIFKNERLRLRSHSKVLSYYLFLFLGMVVAFALWYAYTPPDLTYDIFNAQEATITDINAPVGYAISASEYMGTVFFHNSKVLLFCLIFSLFFGAGAIYILTYNASVIGTAVGMFMKQNIGAAHSLTGLSYGLLRYLPHGVLEITGFFLGGLAGGIVSIAIIHHDFQSDKFKIVLKDSLHLIFLAFVFLFLAAMTEVYITPLFY